MSRIMFASALIIAGTVQSQQYPVAGVVLPPAPPTVDDPDHISAATASLESHNGKTYTPYKQPIPVAGQGAFQFDNVLTGQYRIVARDTNPNGYLPGCKELHAPSKSGNLEVYLIRAVPFDEDHKINGPAVGKRVMITPRYCYGLGPPYFATVDPEGIAHFKGLRLTGRAEQKDYLIQLVQPSAAPGPTTGQDTREMSGPDASDQSSPEALSEGQAEHPQETDHPKALTKPVDTAIQKVDSSFLHPRVDGINQHEWTYDPEKNTLIPVGMTVEQKLILHLQHTFDPSAFFFAAVVGAFNQARNDPPEWGGGVAAYGERVASAYGYHSVVQNSISFVVDGAFHLDPRYYRSTRRGAWQRLSDCLEQTVFTRTDSGSRTFNYWRFAGAYGAGFVSNLWVPSPISTAPRAITRGSVSIALDTGANVAREFLPEMKRILLMRGTPPRKAGKHATPAVTQ